MQFSADEDFAKQLDVQDPLRSFRERFHLPLGKDGKPLIYFAGNSLGLMPKPAKRIVEQELHDWATLGVAAHLEGKTPWYSYHETLREPAARLVGAKPNEVICMNSLTVNLHLMMATFYGPTKSRFKILMEDPAFPSDTYAIKTQIVHHELNPKDALVLARPRKGELTVRTEDVLDLIESHEIAVVLIGGVNFFTGQIFDIPTITAAAQKRGITVGVDLAHAIGNVSLSLHDWNVDFAVWCSYKYLNAGPGAVAGALCMSDMLPIHIYRVWLVGLATNPIPASACISNRNLFPFRRPTDGKSVIHPSWRWRPCACPLRFLTKRAEWNGCEKNQSG